MRLLAPVAALLALLAAGSADAGLPRAAAEARFVPRDECAALPGAASFRAALSRAVRKRDAAALAALADDDVRLDFGGGAGRTLLRQRLSGARGEALWQALDRLLALGCAHQNGQMVLPWFFAQDLGGADAFEVLLVTGRKVAVRAGPGRRARIIGRLSWQLVEPVDYRDTDEPFRKVRMADGRTGYVAAPLLRSPVDYRLLVLPVGRSWRITAFVAGD